MTPIADVDAHAFIPILFQLPGRKPGLRAKILNTTNVLTLANAVDASLTFHSHIY